MSLSLLLQRDHPEWPDTTGEALLFSGTPSCRVWIPASPALVLGNSQQPEKELYVESVIADKVPVYRRIGGGGAVYLSDKCVCYAIRFPRHKDWGIHDYFQQGTGVLQNLLQTSYGIASESKGISDLCIGEQKILGCSLYMPRDFVLYLASVLVLDSTTEIRKYLRHPSKEPEYRAGRNHQDFLLSLHQVNPQITPLALLQKLEASLADFAQHSLSQEKS